MHEFMHVSCLTLQLGTVCRFNQKYGTLGVLDYLHGTDELFQKSKQCKRHFVLLGLSSAKELYPDPPKTKGKEASPVKYE